MKTQKDELNEMIDAVIKLTWNYRLFRALFRKNATDAETRQAHPQFFLTLHDSLFCSFCVTVDLLFEEKPSATSLWSLLRNLNSAHAKGLSKRILSHRNQLRKISSIRNQVCAHRWRAKTPEDVFNEVKLHVRAMTKVVNLARLVILETVREVDSNRRTELKRQQLSESTLVSIAQDAATVLQTFQSAVN
jgi:hypothetical protein